MSNEQQSRRPAGSPASEGGQFAGTPHAEAAVALAADRPVHTFYATGEGYDLTQTDDDIHDGDVLAVPREGVYGFLYEAWPIAVVGGPGHFHSPNLEPLLADKPQYADAVAQARRLAAAAGVTDRPRFGDVEDPEADHDDLNGSALYE